jgi:hypothetical protein
MPSPRGTNRAGLFIDVPSRGATDGAIALHSKPRRYGDIRTRLGRDQEEDDPRLAYLKSLYEQLKLLSPEERSAMMDSMLGDMPGEDRRRGRARDSGDYPVERRDIDDPGAIGGLPREMSGDRRTSADEPPPFYGMPKPGGTVDLTGGQPDLAVRRRAVSGAEDRRYAMDAASRIRVDTVGMQPLPRPSRALSASFARRWPSAARIKVL